MSPLKRNKKRNYSLGFLFLFIIEILIANYVTDDFIRPYLGDYLVAILIYCFLMAISKMTIKMGLVSVLLFSYTVEFFQLINIVKVFQERPPKLIMIILGSSFSFWDLLAYTLGVANCFLIEYGRNRFMVHPRNPVNT